MLTNKILTGLPDAEFASLMPLLDPVPLSAGEGLAGFGETERFIYFPENSVISYHAEMQDGKSAEVGMVGRDGVTGLQSLLGSRPSLYSMNVAVAGSALRVKRTEFERELYRNEGLRQLLLAYAVQYVAQVSQRAACAILHLMGQRLAVWLLLLTDRLDTEKVELTQEQISQHLGVRRAGVTVVARELQQQGIIRYKRGSLRVVNREALRTIACECYDAMTSVRHEKTYM